MPPFSLSDSIASDTPAIDRIARVIALAEQVRAARQAASAFFRRHEAEQARRRAIDALRSPRHHSRLDVGRWR